MCGPFPYEVKFKTTLVRGGRKEERLSGESGVFRRAIESSPVSASSILIDEIRTSSERQIEYVVRPFFPMARLILGQGVKSGGSSRPGSRTSMFTVFKMQSTKHPKHLYAGYS